MLCRESDKVFSLSQSILGEGLRSQVLTLSQITLGEKFEPEPEYSGREIWASARVLWEGVLGLSQNTLGRGFGIQPEYSGRGFWA